MPSSALILAKGGLMSAEHLGSVPRPPRDATIPALNAPPKDDAATFLTIAAQDSV